MWIKYRWLKSPPDAVECDGWVQLTGQMPTDPEDDSKPLPKGVAAQTRRVMEI